MQGYRATVTGEEIEFMIDDELHYLDFSRTVFVSAKDTETAQTTALDVVREELLSQSFINEWDDKPMVIEEIYQVDVLAGRETGDFIWYFPENVLFEETCESTESTS